MDKNDLAFEREIRDPIHRYIKLTRLECCIVDSRPFQRLSRISQMHSAHLVYPGAQYPRKVHALGTMHLAHRQLTRILFMQCPKLRDEIPGLFYMDPPVGEKRGDTLTNIKGNLETMKIEGFPELGDEMEAILYTVQCARLSALLHDVGHAPYSHLYEYATEYGFNHETQGARIVREVLTKPGHGSEKPLLDSADAELVARIMTGDLPATLGFLHSLISSPLDADKMDYLLRDSHYAGTPEYGTIDVDRILDSLVVCQGQLCYASDSLDSVVNALNAMFFMWGTVYSHKTARMFEILLTESMKGLKELLLKLTSDLTVFLELDETNFLPRLIEEAERLGPLEKPQYSEAMKVVRSAFDRLRWREKPYRCVVDTRATIPLGLAEEQADLDVQIDRIARDLDRVVASIEDDTGLFPILDLRRRIRPLGLKLEELFEWTMEQRIFDKQTGRVKVFRDHMPFFKTMTRLVVPVRIYVDRLGFGDLTDQQKERLKSLAVSAEDIVLAREKRIRDSLNV